MLSPNTESDLLQESVSLSIPQKQGEKAIQLLGKLKLLNRKLAPQVIDDQLHVPLARAPKAQEQELLERVLGKQNLLREEFRSRLEPVGSLEKILTQQLPSSIIRLVSKSFDIIGDIAIIELSPEGEPFEKDIAEALMKMNKVQNRMKVWSGDARVVIKNNLAGTATRVIMNHPSQAREFLEAACEALGRDGGIVHYYTFAEGADNESRARKELAGALANSGWKIEKIMATRKVRGVAPMKWQVAIDAELVPA